MRRRDAVERTSGVLAGCHEPGERERLRDEWPAGEGWVFVRVIGEGCGLLAPAGVGLRADACA